MSSSKAPSRRALLAPACLLVAVAAAGAADSAAGPSAANALWIGFLKPLLRMVAFVALGVFLGQVVQALGFTQRLGALVRPLLGWGRFSTEAGASFALAFASGAAAHALLADVHRDGRIGRGELFLASLMNSQPAYLVHLPSTVAILMPLTGTAGLVYLSLTFVAAVLRTLVLVLLGRALLPARAAAAAGGPEARPRFDPRRLAQALLRRLRRILFVVVPVYGGMVAVERLGFFDWIRETVALRFLPLVLPVEAIGVVMMSLMAEFTSAAAAAGALLETGALTRHQTVVALLVGTVLATPLRSLRHQIPMYTGIFEPRLGLQLVALSQGLRVLSVVAVGLVYGAFGG